jgi:hypothetical protein
MAKTIEQGMDGARLRDVLRTGLQPDQVMGLARELGVVERESVIEIVELVNSLVLVSRTPAGGRQADVLRAYAKTMGAQPVRGTFYARFNANLEKLLDRLLRNTLAVIQRDPVLLPAAIAGVKDWIIIDSETVKLHPSLKERYPGTGDYAAVKVHKAYSIGRHNMVDYEFWPARDHDSKRFHVTEAMRGYGLLMDLGYASHDRLRDCIRHGVSVVIKLKDRWKAAIDAVHVGQVRQLLAGTDIADAVSTGRLACENGVIDADVTLGSGAQAYAMRLVAIELPDRGLCVFLTNLPRDRYRARVVGDLYRLRWEIEKSNKLDKSDFCLDELDCRKVCSAHTMLMASLLGSCIVGRLVHADHCALAAAKQPLTHGPIHVRLLALALGSFHILLSTALLRDGDADEEWENLARTLAHLSRDPNWRRRASVLDTMLGFTAVPGRPRRQKAIAADAKTTGTSR